MSASLLNLFIVLVGLVVGCFLIFLLTEYVQKRMIREDIARIHAIYQSVSHRDATIEEIYANAIYPKEYYDKELMK